MMYIIIATSEARLFLSSHFLRCQPFIHLPYITSIPPFFSKHQKTKKMSHQEPPKLLHHTVGHEVGVAAGFAGLMILSVFSPLTSNLIPCPLASSLPLQNKTQTDMVLSFFWQKGTHIPPNMANLQQTRRETRRGTQSWIG